MSSNALPTATEVVVIGGGVATAWHLHQLGVPVVLCEKGRIAGEQSSRNWGWIRKQGRDPAELPLIAESLQRWQAMVTELDEDIGWHVGGVTYLIENDADAARYRAWLEHAEAQGLVGHAGISVMLCGAVRARRKARGARVASLHK